MAEESVYVVELEQKVEGPKEEFRTEVVEQQNLQEFVEVTSAMSVDFSRETEITLDLGESPALSRQEVQVQLEEEELPVEEKEDHIATTEEAYVIATSVEDLDKKEVNVETIKEEKPVYSCGLETQVEQPKEAFEVDIFEDREFIFDVKTDTSKKLDIPLGMMEHSLTVSKEVVIEPTEEKHVVLEEKSFVITEEKPISTYVEELSFEIESKQEKICRTDFEQRVEKPHDKFDIELEETKEFKIEVQTEPKRETEVMLEITESSLTTEQNVVIEPTEEHKSEDESEFVISEVSECTVVSEVQRKLPEDISTHLSIKEFSVTPLIIQTLVEKIPIKDTQFIVVEQPTFTSEVIETVEMPKEVFDVETIKTDTEFVFDLKKDVNRDVELPLESIETIVTTTTEVVFEPHEEKHETEESEFVITERKAPEFQEVSLELTQPQEIKKAVEKEDIQTIEETRPSQEVIMEITSEIQTPMELVESTSSLQEVKSDEAETAMESEIVTENEEVSTEETRFQLIPVGPQQDKVITKTVETIESIKRDYYTTEIEQSIDKPTQEIEPEMIETSEFSYELQKDSNVKAQQHLRLTESLLTCKNEVLIEPTVEVTTSEEVTVVTSERELIVEDIPEKSEYSIEITSEEVKTEVAPQVISSESPKPEEVTLEFVPSPVKEEDEEVVTKVEEKEITEETAEKVTFSTELEQNVEKPVQQFELEVQKSSEFSFELGKDSNVTSEQPLGLTESLLTCEKEILVEPTVEVTISEDVTVVTSEQELVIEGIPKISEYAIQITEEKTMADVAPQVISSDATKPEEITLEFVPSPVKEEEKEIITKVEEKEVTEETVETVNFSTELEQNVENPVQQFDLEIQKTSEFSFEIEKDSRVTLEQPLGLTESLLTCKKEVLVEPTVEVETFEDVTVVTSEQKLVIADVPEKSEYTIDVTSPEDTNVEVCISKPEKITLELVPSPAREDEKIVETLEEKEVRSGVQSEETLDTVSFSTELEQNVEKPVQQFELEVQKSSEFSFELEKDSTITSDQLLGLTESLLTCQKEVVIEPTIEVTTSEAAFISEQEVSVEDTEKLIASIDIQPETPAEFLKDLHVIETVEETYSTSQVKPETTEIAREDGVVEEFQQELSVHVQELPLHEETMEIELKPDSAKEVVYSTEMERSVLGVEEEYFVTVTEEKQPSGVITTLDHEVKHVGKELITEQPGDSLMMTRTEVGVDATDAPQIFEEITLQISDVRPQGVEFQETYSDLNKTTSTLERRETLVQEEEIVPDHQEVFELGIEPEDTTQEHMVNLELVESRLQFDLSRVLTEQCEITEESIRELSPAGGSARGNEEDIAIELDQVPESKLFEFRAEPKDEKCTEDIALDLSELQTETSYHQEIELVMFTDQTVKGRRESLSIPLDIKPFEDVIETLRDVQTDSTSESVIHVEVTCPNVDRKLESQVNLLSETIEPENLEEIQHVPAAFTSDIKSVKEDTVIPEVDMAKEVRIEPQITDTPAESTEGIITEISTDQTEEFEVSHNFNISTKEQRRPSLVPVQVTVFKLEKAEDRHEEIPLSVTSQGMNVNPLETEHYSYTEKETSHIDILNEVLSTSSLDEHIEETQFFDLEAVSVPYDFSKSVAAPQESSLVKFIEESQSVEEEDEIFYDAAEPILDGSPVEYQLSSPPNERDKPEVLAVLQRSDAPIEEISQTSSGIEEEKPTEMEIKRTFLEAKKENRRLSLVKTQETVLKTQNTDVLTADQSQKDTTKESLVSGASLDKADAAESQLSLVSIQQQLLDMQRVMGMGEHHEEWVTPAVIEYQASGPVKDEKQLTLVKTLQDLSRREAVAEEYVSTIKEVYMIPSRVQTEYEPSVVERYRLETGKQNLFDQDMSLTQRQHFQLEGTAHVQKFAIIPTETEANLCHADVEWHVVRTMDGRHLDETEQIERHQQLSRLEEDNLFLRQQFGRDLVEECRAEETTVGELPEFDRGRLEERHFREVVQEETGHLKVDEVETSHYKHSRHQEIRRHEEHRLVEQERREYYRKEESYLSGHSSEERHSEDDRFYIDEKRRIDDRHIAVDDYEFSASSSALSTTSSSSSTIGEEGEAHALELIHTDDLELELEVVRTHMAQHTDETVQVAQESFISAVALMGPIFELPLEDKTARVGEKVVFECIVIGTPRPMITWLLDGIEIDFSQRRDFVESVYLENRCQLILHRVTAQDEGDYTCKATNDAGSCLTTACLTVISRTLLMGLR